jgi:transposase
MFFPEGQLHVYLYGQPADLRRSFDGLQALARQGLGGDPLDGGLYVFISNWRTVRSRTMDWTALKLLLEGIEPARRRKRFQLTRAQENAAPERCEEVNCSDVTTRSDPLIHDSS